MRQHLISQLNDKEAAVDFYEQRYAHGYMDDWPAEKKQRVIEVIRGLDLPEHGEALDFGCGNGVLTDVIRQALPGGWKVHGTDISAIAIANAAERYPGCVFHTLTADALRGKKFDFVFTHHVLEHVHHLPGVLQEIDGFLKQRSAVFHILPCGNEGSFEHRACLLRRDGIDPHAENRFYFEEEGHVRRLNTEQLSRHYRDRGFALAQEYYSNQHYGAIDWITQSGPHFVQMFTDTAAAADEKARNKLLRLRYELGVVSALRYPAIVFEYTRRKRNKSLRDYLLLALGLLPYVIARPINSYIKGKALAEWQRRKTERNGSEMYLIFKR